MGPHLLRNGAYPAYRPYSTFRHRAKTLQWPHGDRHFDSHAGHGGDRRQLRQNGRRLPIGGIGLYLRGQGHQSSPWLSHRLGDDSRLRFAAAAQRRMDFDGTAKPLPAADPIFCDRPHRHPHHHGTEHGGIKTSAKTNKLLMLAMCLVIAVFFYLAVRYLFHMDRWAGVFSIQPFYDPKTFDTHLIWGATSFAALTYIGFDGITTLSEEVKNPRRNVLLATVLVCVLTGVISAVEVYLGQRIWPNWHTFPDLETAFMDVCSR